MAAVDLCLTIWQLYLFESVLSSVQGHFWLSVTILYKKIVVILCNYSFDNEPCSRSKMYVRNCSKPFDYTSVFCQNFNARIAGKLRQVFHIQVCQGIYDHPEPKKIQYLVLTVKNCLTGIFSCRRPFYFG